MDAKIWSMTATYNQDSDDNDEGQLGQEMKLSAEDGGAGKYYVIETKRWAFDNIAEFIDILKDFQARAGMED